MAEFAVSGLGATIAGVTVYAGMTGDYIAATALGIVFRYFAIATMPGPGPARRPGSGGGGTRAQPYRGTNGFEVGLFGRMVLMASCSSLPRVICAPIPRCPGR